MEIKFLNAELIDVLNIEDFASRKEYGRERGLMPSPTEAQTRLVDKISQKINARAPSRAAKEDDEESLIFDLKSKPRVHLFDAPILKRSTTSIVQHHAKRHAYLFNDVMLITSSTTTTSMLNFSSEKLNIHQILFLDQISIRDLKNVDDSEDSAAFEIISLNSADNGKSYILLAESEQDKRIWLEELSLAMFCIQTTVGAKKLGWFHEIVRGTFYSAAYYGEEEVLKKYIQRLKSSPSSAPTTPSNRPASITSPSVSSLESTDESGMTALHWATLNGHLSCVKLLVEAGCDVDVLNSGLNSPLLIAAGFGYRDIIFYLLDRGADIHLRNLKDYDCLLMLLLFGAFSFNVEEIIKAFTVRGIDINKQDITGVAPLHECAARNLPLSIQSLVDAGADINMRHGRSGLTPLQLACSSTDPDVETIRSLLDKGALPNWKDVNRMTAFDLIIQSSRKNLELIKNNDTSTSSGLKKTLEDASDFIQKCLPTLTELARKGARYAPESVDIFRESFREIIKSGVDQFKLAAEPENFQHFVKFKGDAAFRPKQWLSDSASPHCLLCLEKFTYSNRRHHCRTCGTLCCDSCSTKRLKLSLGGGNSPPPAGKSGKGDGGADRVCDSCFNRLVFEANRWEIDQNRRRKEQLRLEQSMLESAAANKNGKLMAGSKSTSNTGGSKIDASNGVMNETMRALEERGQKIAEVAEKSEALTVAAGEFRQMTKQLLQQQQQNAALYQLQGNGTSPTSNNQNTNQQKEQEKKKKK